MAFTQDWYVPPTRHDLAVKPIEEPVKVLVIEADGTIVRRMQCEGKCQRVFDVSEKEYAQEGYVCDDCDPDATELRW